jgi:hypothetical protein
MSSNVDAKIVVLDETPEVRASVTRLLRSTCPRWRVIEARDGADALSHVIHDEITVLVCGDEEVLGRARKLSPDTVGVLLTDSDIIPIDRVRSIAKSSADVVLLVEVANAIDESNERAWVNTTVARLLAPEAHP